MTFPVSNAGQAAPLRRGLLRHACVPGLPTGGVGHRDVGRLLPPLPRLRPPSEALPLRGRRPRPRLPRHILAFLCKVWNKAGNILNVVLADNSKK